MSHNEEITAHRSLLSPATGRHVYAVVMNGTVEGYIRATDLPAARGWARKLAREAFESPWNQTLIFRGDIGEGEISRSALGAAIRHKNERDEK